MIQKFVITGGGTGGHVFPGLSIAQELQRRGHQVIYLGTERGLESKLVPPTGIPFFTLKAGAMKNQGWITRVKTVARIFSGLLWAFRFLGKEKPNAVIGVGGYVSFPTGLATILRGIPLFLQEQNASAGIANQILSRFARKVFLGFPQAEKEFPAGKSLVTGNPVRPMFLNNFPPYQPKANTLFVFGGSQGAAAINTAVISMLPLLTQKFPGIRIIHQTGEKDLERVREAYRKNFSGEHEVTAFITDMASCYEKASLVVSRSGALSVSELIQVGRPALLVPFPRQGKNDQTANAYFLEQNGCARVVEQGENFNDRFQVALLDLLTSSSLPQMAQAFEKLRRGNALHAIADNILAVTS